MNRTYYLYILANPTNTTLYIGVTNNLMRRVYEHKNKLIDGFSSKYGCGKLVFFEETNNISEAILREKQIKKWKRQWKERMIREMNPDFTDLASDWFEKKSS